MLLLDKAGMSLLWLWLKATHIVETPYDWPIGLSLVALDLIWLGEWVRIGMARRGR